jgi:hypothetical protein
MSKLPSMANFPTHANKRKAERIAREHCALLARANEASLQNEKARCASERSRGGKKPCGDISLRSWEKSSRPGPSRKFSPPKNQSLNLPAPQKELTYRATLYGPSAIPIGLDRILLVYQKEKQEQSSSSQSTAIDRQWKSKTTPTGWQYMD